MTGIGTALMVLGYFAAVILGIIVEIGRAEAHNQAAKDKIKDTTGYDIHR
jgi:hypothetical protein